MMKIGIFGGTFNPPHIAHVRLAEYIEREYALDKLFIIPCALPPHKNPPGGAKTADRLTMCKLAFERKGLERVQVLDCEIVRGGKSYTVDTLRELSGADRELYLFIGGDMLLTFKEWREYKTVLSLCKVRVFPREGEAAEIDAFIELLLSENVGDIARVPLTSMELSSTELREEFYAGEKPTGVPKEVENYIKTHGLYQN